MSSPIRLTCPTCWGSGKSPDKRPVETPCPDCGGRRFVPLTVREAEEAFHRSKRKFARDYNVLLVEGHVHYHGFYADLDYEWGRRLELRAVVDGLRAWWSFGSVTLVTAP